MSAAVQLNKRIEITDESLQNGMGSQTQLFVSVNNDHLAYALLDKSKNKFVALCEYRFVYPDSKESRFEQIRSILETDPFLSKDQYRTIGIAVHSFKFSLLPSHFYKKEMEHELLSMTCALNEDAVFSDQLKYADAKIIYAIDQKLINVIGEWFDGAKLFYSATGLIESQLLLNKNNTAKMMTVNVRIHDFDVLVTEANRLIFFNSFRYQTSEDFIYYVLFTCEQLGLNPENISLNFTGEIEKTSAAYFITSKYIRNVSFLSRWEMNEFSYGFDKLPSHFHYSLFSQPLCVL